MNQAESKCPSQPPADGRPAVLTVATPPEDVHYETILPWAKASGCRVDDLIAMGKNRDPFYAGEPRKKVRGEWFAKLWRTYQVNYLRRLHYRLVSLEAPPAIPPSSRQSAVAGQPYTNTEECWTYLQDASTFARHLGLVPAESFVDHRNPPPTLHVAYDRSIPEPDWHVPDLPPWDLPSVPLELADAAAVELPEVEVAGYDYCPADQPYHLELWIEKSTMEDVLLPACAELGINYVPGAGFQSITAMIRMLNRVRHIRDVLPEGKPARVFYVSDFDPAGKHMPVSVARMFEFYRTNFAPGCDLKLTPVALTEAQVLQFNLPRIPIKETDRRKARFEKNHGVGATELDALEAIHPGELDRMIRDAAAPYRDETLQERLEEAREEAEEAAAERWEAMSGDVRRELAEVQQDAGLVITAYRQELARLHEELREELQPYAERLARVRYAALALVRLVNPPGPDGVRHTGLDGSDPARARQEDGVRHTGLADSDDQDCLPDRPEPKTGQQDEDGWLYDSSRTYLEQLAAYRAYRGDGQTEEGNGDE
jgi:hypothetical protein